MKVTKDSGRVVDVHNILAFDVSKLPQAKMHKYNNTPDDELLMANTVAGMPRMKVPVKDGRSQNKFMNEAKKIK